jgi:5-(carboxyamino)imidazole ribonucleotide synthase
MTTPPTPISPAHQPLGVFGGGQLGRMFALAAARLGYPVHVFSPEPQPPAAQVAAHHTRADYNDHDRVLEFAQRVAAVTYEFENIPATTLHLLESVVPVRPGADLLAIASDRIREKTFFRDHHIPVTPFAVARTPAELTHAARAWQQAVVKTISMGYDGKGQTPYRPGDDAEAVWAKLGHPEQVIVEQMIDLEKEFSVLVARDQAGGTVCYGPFYNTHRHHILDYTTWSATDDSTAATIGFELGHAVARALDLTGLLCIEFFVSRTGEIMINEIAPRPHNSGHLTIEACSISQFEQQARLTAGGSAIMPAPRAPAAAMANLLGDLWTNGEPDWAAVLNNPRLSLHLYNKGEPRPGRKMGHLTALAETPAEAQAMVLHGRNQLTRTF